jgi:Alpha/beta hydrolase domain
MMIAFHFTGKLTLRVLTFVTLLALWGTNAPASAAEITLEGPLKDGVLAASLSNPLTLDLGPLGYEGVEFIYTGTANSYQPVAPLTTDGKWTTKSDASETYSSRLVVWRPKNPRKFNGTVFVEWMNVTNGHYDSPVDWRYDHNEVIREGAVWIGVSAQGIGVNGAKMADALRYQALSHPGDSFSYDIFGQAGMVIRQQVARILPGMKISKLIADGESQSAGRFVTYIDGVHQHHKVYDGFFLHSRFRGGAALAQSPQSPVTAPTALAIRNDLDVPVFVFESEFDVNGPTRQPNTDNFRLWEVAGTSHVDKYQSFGVADDGKSAAKIADEYANALLLHPVADTILGTVCEAPGNAGADYFVINAAIHHMQAWVAHKKLPPVSPLMTLVTLDPVKVSDDDHGNGMGGIRTPFVDVPVAKLGPQGEGPGFCRLGGSTTPFSPQQLRALYRSPADFVAKWSASTDDTIRKGFILTADRRRLVEIGDKLSEAIK